ACTVLGDPQQVADGIAAFVERHQPDELMLTANLYDHRARLRSFELAMHAWHARHAG
ncbi:LLM class flavin-dependent oxidoreductase, partial [Stenotrophomonas sp. 2YAF22]